MAAQFWAPKHALPQEVNFSSLVKSRLFYLFHKDIFFLHKGHSVPTVKFAWSGLQELTLLRKPREGPCKFAYTRQPSSDTSAAQSLS